MEGHKNENMYIFFLHILEDFTRENKIYQNRITEPILQI